MPTTDIFARRAATPALAPPQATSTRGWWDRCRAYCAMDRLPGAVRELDGLRGIAVLLVLLRHGRRPFARGADPWLDAGGWNALSPLLNGWMGVDLFFVLSGYLISAHILQRWPSSSTGAAARRYVGKRLLRIVPAYYAVLRIVAAGLVPFYPRAAAALRGRERSRTASTWSTGVKDRI